MTNLKQQQEAMTASDDKRKERANALQMDDGPSFNFGETPSREKEQTEPYNRPLMSGYGVDDRPNIITSSGPERSTKSTCSERVNKQTSSSTSFGESASAAQVGKGKGKGGKGSAPMKKKSEHGPFARFSMQHAGQEMKWLEQQMQSDPFAAHGAVHTSRKFMEACVANNLERAREIEEAADEADWLQDYVYLALKHGVTTMNADLVKLLVNDFSLPLSTHKSCKTYLHDVCERTTEDNFPDAVRILTTLSQGKHSLDIDEVRTPDFYTPLCVAVKMAMPPLVFHLLELGAVVNVMTKSDETPLSIALNLQGDVSPVRAEAKMMIVHMLKSFGALDSCKEIMKRIRAGTLSVQPRKPATVTSAESIPEARQLPLEEDDK